MPTPEQIIEDLREIAIGWRFLAIFWHGYFGVFTLAFLFDYRPSRRTTGVLLALPLLSVSALAWMASNPFNGITFAVSGIVLVVISQRLTSRSVQIGPYWLVVIGALLVALGWSYPHFLRTTEAYRYLYSAPIGLVPCPTLSIVIGAGLIFMGLESRAWSLVAGLTGLFYGVFGVVRLGVLIDWGLVIGSLAILLLPAMEHADRRFPRSLVGRNP